MHNFTTRASSRLERSRQWRAVTKVPHVEFDDDREASLRGAEFGVLRLCIVSMGCYRVLQSEADARQLTPTIKFLFQEEGATIVHQAGQSHRLDAGQWCALRKDLSFQLEVPEPSRQLAITVPCDIVPGPRCDPSWWRQSRTFLRGPSQVLHAYASASVLTSGNLECGERAMIGRHLAELIAMTIHASDMNGLPDIREERRRAILVYIDRHLDDPELGVAQIARAFGLSARSVHKLFEGEAHTVARAIWERRLERCRDEMADPSLTARSITAIAHQWGFSDSQHFSRAFKLRYGLTPRHFRNMHALH